MPVEHVPAARVVIRGCGATGAAFVDLDADAVDDFVLMVDGTVYAWPSSDDRRVRVWHVTPNPASAHGKTITFVPAAGLDRPARMLFLDKDLPWIAEFVVGADLEIARVWSAVPSSLGGYFLGDIDGDETPDVWYDYGVRLSGYGTSVWSPLPTPPEGPYFFGSAPIGVGDVNHDGYDDAVLPVRTSVDLPASSGSTWSGGALSYVYGPASLYLGSPEGILSEPLWTLSAAGFPDAGVGRAVVRIPGEDVLAVSVIEQEAGDLQGDRGPGAIGLIRDAGSAEAYLDASSVVSIEDLDPEGAYDAWLTGAQVDVAGAESPALVFFEDDGRAPDGVQWLPWDPAGSQLGEAVSARFSPSEMVLDPRFRRAVEVRRADAAQVVVAKRVYSTAEVLLIWGRRPEEVGPGAEPMVDGECAITAEPYSDEPPAESAEVIPPPGPLDTRGGGCGCASGASAEGPWAMLVAVAWTRRRSASPVLGRGRRRGCAVAVGVGRCVQACSAGRGSARRGSGFQRRSAG